ncbi:cation diffusion facilitator family transporter [Macrococcus equipercicus]|uniref:Cation transporter n=1 Tax=Macrococcus equipercicus TaxID=69967 RepID=A0A9Q9BMP8_9STAP|nr:cation diffusion facilitator family transporter [Macrococcus equipercicus]KAA1039174.1 cation transporter [Macrococcus equipercicus]UTH13350.1 cation transporter [Macrococcus equipercicus]
MHIKDKLEQAKKGARLSILMYIVLTLAKLLFGWINGSQALIADGLNNATDVISSIALLVGLSISMKPADSNHNYGHYRSEFIASLTASFIMFAVSVQVIVHGVTNFLSGTYSTPTAEAAVVAIISAAVMFCVYLYNRNLARKVDSSALKAAAYDNLSDALVSVGTFIGVMGVYVGVPMLDTIAAIVVGFIIMKTAVDIFRDTAITLTDGFEVETLDRMRHLVSSIPGVIQVVDLKGRNHGVISFVDVTVTVLPTLSVKESHDIAEQIEQQMKEEFGSVETIVHIEPEE